MAANEHEMRLNRSHRLVFPHAELDFGRAVLIPAFAHQAELSLAPLPGPGLVLEPLVQRPEAHLVLRHLLPARVHESDSKPIEIAQPG